VSGDVYAAEIARALHHLDPQLRIVGIVGERGKDAGVEAWASIEQLSVMGFGEVLRHLPRLRSLARGLARRASEDGVCLFLPIDYPGFHMELARHMCSLDIPTLDFIPPKTWSWGAWRARRLRRYVEHCAVIFPFEAEHYRSRGIDSTFVGHPLVDVHADRLDASRRSREGLLIASGSREQELRRLGAPLGEALATLRRTGVEIPLRLSRAPGVESRWLEPIVDRCPEVEIIEGRLFEHLQAATAAIVCSGTATVEAALARTPHLIVYRTSALSYLIARSLITVAHIGMANIVLGRRVFPEFVQNDLRGGSLASAVRPLLIDEGEARNRQLAACDELRRRLGAPGCFQRVAELALSLLAQR
jgi:lipid-A-disaccharide synthase